MDIPVGRFLSLNASPDLVLCADFLKTAFALVPRPLVLEITEESPIADYVQTLSAVNELGGHVLLAVDDAGAGFASFRHIIELRPAYVKLDIGLIKGIHADPARQALVAGMVYFAQRSGCSLIAEGIEGDSDLAILKELGVPLGQGYHLGRPAPAAAWSVAVSRLQPLSAAMTRQLPVVAGSPAGPPSSPSGRGSATGSART